MNFMKNMNGISCGQRLKKLAKILFYVWVILAIVLIVIGIFTTVNMLSVNSGAAFGVLFVFIIYSILLLFLSYITYLNLFATGNQVEIQEKQYELLKDLCDKLYDDGVLNKNENNKLEF